ncbi:MAG: carbohydrate kinase family protein [Phototrophicales bacterium]|nr:MAG: carbohydrate kinase family protein [Phototrophicales bacterium]RMG75177.1 MAG: carbohydrate kinase family protein [Chloroflexota bacterium]
MNVIATGSIAYDYLMRFPGKFRDHFIAEQLHQVSLSFLVDDMTKHWGGVAANIAYTMALLGMRPKLMGTAGRDFPDYRMWLESVGVDCSIVKQIDEVFTASFFCNTDVENNQIASFYAGAMSLASQYSLKDALNGQMDNVDMVIISPNDPKAMSNLAEECRQHHIRFIYDPSQQVPRLSGEELRRDMDGAHAMIVNAYEAEVISQKTGLSLDDLRDMIDILVITRGKHGSTIYTNGHVTDVKAFPAVNNDPTGGGDAFRAGFVTGLLHNWSLELAAQVGSLCASYCIEQIGTQSHKFTIGEFIGRFRTEYDDNGALDVLLSLAKS